MIVADCYLTVCCVDSYIQQFLAGDSTTAVSVGELYEQVGAHQCALAQHTWWQQRRCQCVSGQFVHPLLLLSDILQG